ncbi:MAG: aminotransferase class V-fold PLP-dependent enzyme [Saprospiraceae bacterium]|nr:aminotransferase class V-fold PLP-dependent enzyme [Saprospiraceae bacterium]
MDKRSFLKNAGTALIGATMPLQNLFENPDQVYDPWSPEDLASEESFWKQIRKGYRLKSEYINLENGYYCFMPQSTLERFVGHVREVNYQGAYYMRTVQTENKDKSAKKLADMLGCGHDEVVITRNTTESLDTVINGYDWKQGDEAVMAEQDYGSIVNQFKLMERRYGIVNKIVSVPNHPKSDEEIIDLYASAITPKTRLIMICHMINITGQILPVKKICDMAHSKGVDVMVDGAHAIAHIDFNMNDLGCDYYGASLHKWLSTPLGAGLLYVRKDKIKALAPTLATWTEKADDIKKLNHTGTHPVHTDLAVIDAINFYEKIGKKRKEERLRYLQRYWSDQVRNIKGITVNTPEDPKKSCGIANVGIDRMKPAEMAKTLLEKYKIYTVAIDGQGVHGCRITPNLYTTTAELDVFVKALKEMA